MYGVGQRVKVIQSHYNTIPVGTYGVVVENATELTIKEMGKDYRSDKTQYTYLVSLDIGSICQLTFCDAQLIPVGAPPLKNEYAEAHRQAKKFTALFKLAQLLRRFGLDSESTEQFLIFDNRITYSERY